MQIQPSKEFEIRVEDLYKYYLFTAGQNIADEFYLKLKKQFLRLEKFPSSGARYKLLESKYEIRFVILEKFPYVLVYFVDEKEEVLHLTNLYHEKQNIKKHISKSLSKK